LHSPVYWEKFHVLQYPVYTEQLCRLISSHFAGYGAEVVAGPTTGGVILAHEVGRQLGLRSIYAEKDADGGRSFRRGFEIRPGEKVLAVDDILTTGKSVFEVLKAVRDKGGKVVGIGVLVDRSEENLSFGAPLFSCLHSATVKYKAGECPQCAAGIPLTRPGGG
jgi:orotate phosphoribosyltransferase